jgi:hypothetical protein
MFQYNCAIVRHLSSEFEKSLSLEIPAEPINVENAKNQHDKYESTLKSIVPRVIALPAEDKYPDCVFIEVLRRHNYIFDFTALGHLRYYWKECYYIQFKGTFSSW